MEYRTSGLDFQPGPMLLDNTANYSHLQRSIDTLRTLGDRLGERNVDLRLNLHQDLRNNDLRNVDRLNCDRNPLNNGLELNLSLNSERMQQERLQQERLQQERLQQERLQQERLQQERLQQERLQQERNLNLERIMNERNLNPDRLGLDHVERLNLERSLQQQTMDRVALTDRNLNNVDRMLNNDNNRNISVADRLRSSFDMQNDISDIKYREYKAHLDSLRNNESSRTVEGRPPAEGPQEERGNSSTPPTPLSVGENFQEEKVFFTFFFLSLTLELITGDRIVLLIHYRVHFKYISALIQDYVQILLPLIEKIIEIELK